MKLIGFDVGVDRPLFLIAGPCVIESEALILDVAGKLKEITGALHVPFIEGDGTGPDIWRATKVVIDGAVKKSYGGKRKIEWYEVYAGDKATATTYVQEGMAWADSASLQSIMNRLQ